MSQNRRKATILDGEHGATILRLFYQDIAEPEAVIEYVGPGAARRAWLEAARWRSLGVVYCYGGTTVWRSPRARLHSAACTIASTGKPAVRLAEREGG